MKKEELLKIYSAYLPYGLKGRTIYNPNDDESNEDCTLVLKDDLNNAVGIDEWVNQCSYPIKPYLYDLSYLTKEIDHEGEKFVPMVYFIKKTSLFDLSKCTFEVYEDDGEIYVNAHDGDRVIDSIFYDGNIFWSSKLLDIHEGFRPANPQHFWQEMLLHLHFNVFGLPEGEYTNKATLKQ